MQSVQLTAGVDVGGTKIAAGLVDPHGRVVACRRTQTAPEGGGRVLSQIADLLHQLIEDAAAPKDALSAIGIAVPAVVDQERGLVLWAPNIPGWQHEVAVTRPIAEAFEVPVSLHYDGHAWVTGEWWRGAARGARDVALLAVGTGIGGGMILGGRLHRGRIGVAGAVGWWVIDRPQTEVARRKGEGWLESIASGRAIAKASGKPTAEEAFRAAREGDTGAEQAVERATAALGAAFANLLSLLDPDVVVLAGGVIAGGADLLLPRIREIAAREAQPQIAAAARIVAAELGEDAAWIGAARLARDSLNNQEEDS